MTIFKNRDTASTPSTPRNTAAINPFKTVIFSVKNINLIAKASSSVLHKFEFRTLIKEEGFGLLYKLDKLQSHVLRYSVLKFAPLLVTCSVAGNWKVTGLYCVLVC
ncbi:uncharacterized protein LOC133735735 isoform X2 [Rosa rugosa]|uniref:uncharacterized protein LOC133735735 isoform X2 n=1 Tax=Rosa rugosa TaxID=74645 RepID=UPI002B41335D|nr:uncharacterized protein LOC133735735 isoform X2 [Rosa rugosa]